VIWIAVANWDRPTRCPACSGCRPHLARHARHHGGGVGCHFTSGCTPIARRATARVALLTARTVAPAAPTLASAEREGRAIPRRRSAGGPRGPTGGGGNPGIAVEPPDGHAFFLPEVGWHCGSGVPARYSFAHSFFSESELICRIGTGVHPVLTTLIQFRHAAGGTNVRVQRCRPISSRQGQKSHSILKRSGGRSVLM